MLCVMQFLGHLMNVPTFFLKDWFLCIHYFSQIFIKFLLVFIAICCAPVLFVLLIVFFALLMAATGLIAALPAVLYEVLPAVNWATVGSSPGLTVAMSVAGILVIGIPIIGLIHIDRKSVV